MRLPLDRVRFAFLRVLLTLAIVGCRPGGSEPPEPLPSPPYEMADGGLVRVRRDLIAQFQFARAERSELRATLQGFGRVAFAPGASYAVRSAFAAYVDRVLVDVGQAVQRGTALAALRSPEVARQRGELRRVQVELATARDDAQRVARMAPEGAASARELVEARARVASLQAELTGVMGALSAVGAASGSGDAFTLRASAPGHVIARFVDPGERVDPAGDEPAFLVGDASAVVVQASFPEREAPMLAVGAPCTFGIAALGADRFEGSLAQVVRAVDADTHTATAICRPRSVDPRLRAAMVAQVEVEVRGAPSVTVPRGAVLLRRDERVVFVRRGGDTFERRVVATGSQFGDRVQVLQGLSVGDEVASDGAVLLDGELDQML